MTSFLQWLLPYAMLVASFALVVGITTFGSWM